MKTQKVDWEVVKYYRWKCPHCSLINETRTPETGERWQPFVECKKCGSKSKLDD